MNILIVGHKAVYEAYLTAAIYLDQKLDEEVFGNLKLEKQKLPIRVGRDAHGNQVYILGNSAAEKVGLVNDELNRVDNWTGSSLIITTVKLSGVWLTIFLAKLSLLPGIGTFFNKFASAWTLSHREELKVIANDLTLKVNQTFLPSSAAAKPLPNK